MRVLGRCGCSRGVLGRRSWRMRRGSGLVGLWEGLGRGPGVGRGGVCLLMGRRL